MKENSQEKFIFYMEDAMFYALWKFVFPGLRSSNKADYSDFSQLSPMSAYYAGKVFNLIETHIKAKKLNFPKLFLYSNVDPKEELHLPPSQDDLARYSENEKKEILQASNNILKDKFSIKDIKTLLHITSSFLNYIYFYTNIDKKTRLGIIEVLDDYINQYLNNQLLVVDRSYFTFEKQKQVFFEKIKKSDSIKKYGHNFIISHTIKPILSETLEFLFMQTLYAMQKLGYLKVLDFWHENDDLSDKKYCANIVLEDKLIEEINEVYKTENPKTNFEKFDEKRGILNFAGKQIVISKGGKETYPLQLLQTLSKDTSRHWFEDEILEDWGYTEEEAKDLPKNRVYFASLKVNNIVARSIQIDDFIEHTTEKFRINPKYLKS